MSTNPAWTPNAAIAAYYCILDSNGNVQQASSAGGTSGAVEPTWNNVLGATTSDGGGTSGSVVTWTCIIVLQIESFPNGVVQLPAPQFLTDADGTDPTLVLADMISQFQTASGRTLYPAQVERLLINLYAYREALIRQAIQYTGQQNLLLYASFPMIDYLGQLLGVTREDEQPASCTLAFYPSGGGFTVPAGTAVGTQDGAFVFVTTKQVTYIDPTFSGSFVTSPAVCTTVGPGANGYLVGEVSVLLNPNPQIASVTNTNVTSDGDNVESDSHLRTRIQAAPGRFSVAGPTGAYRFWALTADSTIIDVQIVTPVPGTVQVFVLTGPITNLPTTNPNTQAIASSEVIAEVLAILSADDIRPLTDTVEVNAVTENDYQITGVVSIFANADPVSTLAAAQASALAYATAQASRIGRDIILTQLYAAIVNTPGVYDVFLSEPAGNIVISSGNGQWVNCTAINLTSVVVPYEPS